MVVPTLVYFANRVWANCRKLAAAETDLGNGASGYSVAGVDGIFLVDLSVSTPFQ